MRETSASEGSASATCTSPLVSVVMNGFNSARYLGEAIESLRQQTFANWEMVFWDNCSDDESETIVRGFADARLHFYRAPHLMTLAAGRNAAISRARGKWIAFLDCDDLWSPDKLARQLAFASAWPDAGLIYCRTQSFSARGDEGETTYRYAGHPLPEGKILRPLLLEGNLVPIVSAMVSRQAVDAVGAIPTRYTFAEDYWLFVAIAARFSAHCVQDVCCHYRVHPDSATYRNKLASHQEALDVLEQFGTNLERSELAARRAVYHTLIGIEMSRLPGQRAAGLMHMFNKGSLSFLLRGAIATLWRRWFHARRPYS